MKAYCQFLQHRTKEYVCFNWKSCDKQVEALGSFSIAILDARNTLVNQVGYCKKLLEQRKIDNYSGFRIYYGNLKTHTLMYEYINI